MPNIVQTNVFQVSAPVPILLQQSGAIISAGGTTLASGGTADITQASDLTAILSAPLAISSITWASNVANVTTGASIPGLSTGDKFRTTIAGVTPTGYNGLVLATVTGANTFTYPLAVNPGTETVVGTYTPPGQAALVAAGNSYFGNGVNQAFTVLELGPADGTSGPPLLNTWIQANPQEEYLFLVPREWDGTAAYLALIAQYESDSAMVYFFTTTTLATYSAYTGLMKCVHALVEAPGTPLTEFTEAAVFQQALKYAPSSSNRMTQFCFAPLSGVTPWKQKGNNATLKALKAANINYVGTGAEGGLPNQAILFWGTMLDGNDFSYWYGGDWLQLTGDQALANAVIEGSASGANPLSYDQPGVNRLQDVLYQVAVTGVSFNLLNGNVGRAALDGTVFQQNLNDGDYTDTNIVNAVPFVTYATENEGNYQAGIYGGLTCVALIQRGFRNIIFNVQLTSFVSQ